MSVPDITEWDYNMQSCPQDVHSWGEKTHRIPIKSYKSDYFQYNLSQGRKSRHWLDVITCQVMASTGSSLGACEGGDHLSCGVSAHLIKEGAYSVGAAGEA